MSAEVEGAALPVLHGHRGTSQSSASNTGTGHDSSGPWERLDAAAGGVLFAVAVGGGCSGRLLAGGRALLPVAAALGLSPAASPAWLCTPGPALRV